MILLRLYRALLRLLRPNSGLTKLSFNRVVNRLFAGIQGPLPGSFADGLPIEVDPQDYHGRILWLFGTNDWKVSRTTDALLTSGDVMLDIGANYGSIGLAARHRVGAAGHVHFFEPQPLLARRLHAAIAAAGGAAMSLHEIALFDSDGEMQLALQEGHSGLASLVGTVAGLTPDATVEVPVRETEAFVRPLVAGRSFGVKIDIEGAEMHVLPGLARIGRLKFVVFEGDRNQRALYDFFVDNGFVIYGLCRTVLRCRVRMLDGFEDWQRFHDFVAVPAAAALPGPPVPIGRLAAAVARGHS